MSLLQPIPVNLRALDERLRESSTSASARVYVEGAWVDRVPTVPLEGGAAAVTRFARDCWQKWTEGELNRLKADQSLADAETALRVHALRHPDIQLAAVFAAIDTARGYL